MTLQQYIAKLIAGWLEGGLVPPSLNIRVVEISGKTPLANPLDTETKAWIDAQSQDYRKTWFPNGRLWPPTKEERNNATAILKSIAEVENAFDHRYVIQPEKLYTPEDYENRFGELMTQGRDWFHIRCFGIVDNFLIMGVEFSEALAAPGCSTKENLSGPTGDWNASHFLVLKT